MRTRRSGLLVWVAGLAVCSMLLSSAARAAEGPEVVKLRQAYEALRVANGDYKGHRAKAMKEIEAAAKEMGVEIKGSGEVHERQAESDAHLKRARQLLESISDSAAGTKHIHNAVKEITSALTVK